MRRKKTGGSRVTTHRWLLNTEAEIEAIALAELGQSNQRIVETTGLTDGSVSYLLGKAKRLEGYQKYHTYRSEWRNGTGGVVQSVMPLVLQKLKDRAADRLPKLITHPAPQVAPSENP